MTHTTAMSWAKPDNPQGRDVKHGLEGIADQSLIVVIFLPISVNGRRPIIAEVFISYSRQDKDFVRRLSEALAAQKRAACVDWKDIPLTAEWQEEIFLNIESADSFIFVIRPHSVASANCKREIEHAAVNHKRMVPIFYRPVPDTAIPESLARFQRIDFAEEGDAFDADFAALLNAFDTDLVWTQAHTRLLTRVKEWDQEGKDKSFLLRGKNLREAEEMVAKAADREPKPTMMQSQYIRASRQSATKTQRIIIAGVAMAFLVALALAVYAFRQKNVAQCETHVADENAAEAKRQQTVADANAQEATRQKETAVANAAEARRQQDTAKEETDSKLRNARESRARELTAYATAALNQDPELSVILAVHAVNATLQFGQAPVPVAENVLHGAVLPSQVRMTLRGHSDTIRRVAFSYDGKRLATAGDNRTARVWDAGRGQELLTLSGHRDRISAVSISHSGKLIATAGWDGTLRIWHASGLQQAVIERPGHFNDVAFSPDEKRLVSAVVTERQRCGTRAADRSCSA